MKESDQFPPAHEAEHVAGTSRPPNRTRFQQGQSGNPRGRPRGARGRRKIVEEVARELHWVTEQGIRARRTTFELAILIIRNLALEGDRRAFVAFHALSRKYEPQETASKLGYLIVPECPSNWIERVAEQQAWLVAQAAKIEAGELDRLEPFASKFEPPRSRPKIGG